MRIRLLRTSIHASLEETESLFAQFCKLRFWLIDHAGSGSLEEAGGSSNNWYSIPGDVINS